MALIERQTIAQQQEAFVDLLRRAEALLHAGRPAAAAVYAEIAANFAMSKHTGLFASPRLEAILLEIGRNLPGQNGTGHDRPAAHPRPAGPPRRVLHVLTRAFGIGGDTRMVWRWIREDEGRCHSVALTRQGALPVPLPLTEAVTLSGGRIAVLNEIRGGLIEWAAALRHQATLVDVVVLHVHPYDVIPTLAFADKTGLPPVVYADHADHAFWVGVGVADVVAALRHSGARLAQERRGVPQERSALLPIALQDTQRTISRHEAKRRLGIDPGTTLLLTVARPHKYVPLDGLSLPRLVLPALQAHPEVSLLAIGPEDAGDWQEAKQITGGQVRALGMRTDTALYYQAADLYLDSFPIVSITSLLEAGAYATPLLSLCPHSQGTVLGADTPGLDRCLLQAASPAVYQNYLGRLLARPALRERLGRRTQQAIAQAHTGPPWRRSLEDLYRQAASLPQNTAPTSPTDRPAIDEVVVLLAQICGEDLDLSSITRFHLRLLPLDLRLRLWWQIGRVHWKPLPGLLLPEWLGVALEKRGLSRPA